ncbi:alanine racemase [Nocardia puris]|uniref:alanine racemase n=1 Tax=Nocardia puris TaxID=208602 RepID=UPI0008318E27|nr:alanine racemase [Nocardia puris]
MGRAAVEDFAHRTLGPEHKSLPPAAWGATVREFLATNPCLDDFQTPLLTLDRATLDANLAVMGEWARRAGVRLAPHGKTTMAPQLWAEQVAAGCWGITLATPWQVQAARAFGVSRIVLANSLVDPVALRWLAGELARDPEFEFCCWVDDLASVALMDAALADTPGGVRVRVLVELGGAHGRTGVRRVEDARALAEAVRSSRRLILGGVAGYEGALAHDRGADGVAAVRGYLDEMARLHRDLTDLYEDFAVVTAGGSAFQDLVVERLAPLADETGSAGAPTAVVLRSGAYVVHDDGFYAGISPLAAGRADRPLRSAMHGWARVISRPEPELALLDAGKRDFPFDEGLPVPQYAGGQRFSDVNPAAQVTALNDQHTFLRLPGAAAGDLQIGTVVRLGLSHPCTAFDKWRLIPVIDSADAADPRVVDLVHTFF